MPTPLLRPRDRYLYVGSSDGRLYQIDLLSGPVPVSASVLLGDGSGAVGNPSYDVHHFMIYVGTEQGVLYGVLSPF